jgi:hypothetical protein
MDVTPVPSFDSRYRRRFLSSLRWSILFYATSVALVTLPMQFCDIEPLLFSMYNSISPAYIEPFSSYAFSFRYKNPPVGLQ